jgi:small subunit ribosomal protein S3
LILEHINIEEIKKTDIDAILVSQSIDYQLECRVVIGGEMKMIMKKVFKSLALSIKIYTSGCLNEAEITRVEKYWELLIILYVF